MPPFAVLLLLLPLASGATATPPTANLTGPWQLFMDDEQVQSISHSVRRRYHQFTKFAGNPVLSNARVRWQDRFCPVRDHSPHLSPLTIQTLLCVAISCTGQCCLDQTAAAFRCGTSVPPRTVIAMPIRQMVSTGRAQILG